jgi:hypothetical protein
MFAMECCCHASPCGGGSGEGGTGGTGTGGDVSSYVHPSEIPLAKIIGIDGKLVIVAGNPTIPIDSAGVAIVGPVHIQGGLTLEGDDPTPIPTGPTV